jgi:hypothetical protein
MVRAPSDSSGCILAATCAITYRPYMFSPKQKRVHRNSLTSMQAEALVMARVAENGLRSSALEQAGNWNRHNGGAATARRRRTRHWRTRSFSKAPQQMDEANPPNRPANRLPLPASMSWRLMNPQKRHLGVHKKMHLRYAVLADEMFSDANLFFKIKGPIAS